MIVAGAGGHAKEIAGILSTLEKTESIYFFDNVSHALPPLLLDKFKILRSEDDVKVVLQHDPRFVIGIGNPQLRFKIAQLFISLGGVLTSVISPHARIGSFNVKLAEGLNVMTGAVITEDVSIGRGSLVHVQSSIHHDCSIGEFCEVLPGAHILGNVTIGDFTSVGSGAVVLPKITIGSYVTIGAGAVVTRNVSDGVTVRGIPAR